MEIKIPDKNDDFLNSWREDVGMIKDENGNRKYYGSCEEEDSLVTSIREYEKEKVEKENSN